LLAQQLRPEVEKEFLSQTQTGCFPDIILVKYMTYGMRQRQGPFEKNRTN